MPVPLLAVEVPEEVRVVIRGHGSPRLARLRTGRRPARPASAEDGAAPALEEAHQVPVENPGKMTYPELSKKTRLASPALSEALESLGKDRGEARRLTRQLIEDFVLGEKPERPPDRGRGHDGQTPQQYPVSLEVQTSPFVSCPRALVIR